MPTPIWTENTEGDWPLVGAHRGASMQAAENTAAAFETAIAAGADFVETDLRLTRDGLPIAFHDPDLRRLFGDARSVAEADLQELRTLHPPLMTIAEVVDLVGERASILLDTKIMELEELRHAAGLLAPRLRGGRVAIGVRSLAVLDIVRQELPYCPTLGLFADASDYLGLAARGGTWARLWEPDATADAISVLQEHGLKVVVMTGRPADGSVGLIEPGPLQELLCRRPHAVMLNDPALAVTLRRRGHDGH